MASSKEKSYNTLAEYSSRVLVKGTPEYERCRRNSASADTPERYPQEIHIVRSSDDVSVAIKRAGELGVAVGVRSGGHLFPAFHLEHNGILIDTTHLKRGVHYDRQTQQIEFGPACRVREMAEFLETVDRFFPHGHAPTVGAGGFLLAGGYGWFQRGWGATCQKWLTKLQIVVPDGRTVIASRTENQDLFWAARGCGTHFFGVVTKFWGHTIPKLTFWQRQIVFEVRDNFQELMAWMMDCGDTTPKFGTDLNAATFWDCRETLT